MRTPGGLRFGGRGGGSVINIHEYGKKETYGQRKH